MRRWYLSVLVIGVLTMGSVGAAFAHHGWRWTTGGNIELTGMITAARLGNPHGVLTVDAEGQVWRVEDKRVKAERLYIGPKEYKLYPERD